jgi:hypothetical protein
LGFKDFEETIYLFIYFGFNVENKNSRFFCFISEQCVGKTHDINVHVLTYVKNEGNNLSTMTSMLTFVVFYEILRLLDH